MQYYVAGWLIAIISTIVCISLWFRDAKRIILGRRSMVESALSQLEVNRANAQRNIYDETAAAVLKRSESIYCQAVELYNQSLRRLWVRLPAFLMGFRPINGNNAAVQIKKKPQKPKSGERYIGSVRFFKNLILLAVIIMIATPTALSVKLMMRLRDAGDEIKQHEAVENDLQHENEVLSQTLLELEQMPAAEPTVPELWELFAAESPYAELYPDFYAPQAFCATERESKIIYLTFDDGPSLRTIEILDILKEKEVKATFFIVGSEVEGYEDVLRRIVAEGHTLGMHTYSHRYNEIYASVEAYLGDMYKVFTRIKEITGTVPTVFRFPGGSINAYNGNVYQELISEMLRRGFVPHDWNMANSDALVRSLVPADELVNNVIMGARRQDRGIVLMHDSLAKTTTVEALSTTIDQLREMGFELKPLTPEVMPVLFSYDD